MNKVTVVGFLNEESEAEFLRQISEATLNSLLSLPAASAPARDLPVVKVCRLRSPRRQFGPQGNEYAAYYGLNAAAVAMCEDLEMLLQTVGEMDDMPAEVSYDLEAHYLPKAGVDCD